MSRYIDADALYEQIVKKEELARQRVLDTPSRMPNGDFNPSAIRYSTQLDERTQMKFMIADAPTVDIEPQWIPCSERLPEEKGEYLVTYHPCYWDDVEDDIRVGIDTFRGRTTWAKKKYQRVIAWMPLPKPYEVK